MALFLSVLIVMVVGFGESVDVTHEEFKKFLQSRIVGKPKHIFSHDSYPWERSGKFEGDILLSEVQKEALSSSFSMTSKRNGIIDVTKRWPKGIVPYRITPDFTKSETELILKAMQEIESKSCIRFRVKTTDDNDYVSFKRAPQGCYAMVGMQGGSQVVNLNPGTCFVHGTIMHELLHTIGFFHMQSNPERDDYVKINWENIEEGEENNFKKYSGLEVTNFGVPYDYNSITHYSTKAFSKNEKETITPVKSVHIGQRTYLSEQDIEKINKMYECVQSPMTTEQQATKSNRSLNKIEQQHNTERPITMYSVSSDVDPDVIPSLVVAGLQSFIHADSKDTMEKMLSDLYHYDSNSTIEFLLTLLNKLIEITGVTIDLYYVRNTRDIDERPQVSRMANYDITNYYDYYQTNLVESWMLYYHDGPAWSQRTQKYIYPANSYWFQTNIPYNNY